LTRYLAVRRHFILATARQNSLVETVEEGKASSSVDSRLRISGMTKKYNKGVTPLITPEKRKT